MSQTLKNAARPALLLAGAWALVALNPASAAPTRPNVLVMIADDLGSGDVSSLFRSVVPTPNIDRMAKKGIKFSAGYATAPLSGPSRGGFLSGCYQQRLGFEDNDDVVSSTAELMPASFKKAGYATALIGKWHWPGSTAQERGYDEFLGYTGPFSDYYKPRLEHNGVSKVYHEYSTDLFTREGQEYIEHHKDQDKPFFLTLAFNAPHIARVVVPFYKQRAAFDAAQAKGEVYQVQKAPTARPGEAEKLQSQFPGDAPRADAVATIMALDQGVGRILDTLEKTGLDQNTIIFFFSDNGGHPENRSENLPLFEYKWSMYEGGFRVPFFAVYPKAFPAGLDFKSPVSSMDIFPTCAALAGVATPPQLDGVDLSPFVSGQNTAAPHPILFWRMGPSAAVREGDWKLIIQASGKHLFNLTQDVAEKTDLAATHPEIVERLEKAWQKWNRELPPVKAKNPAKAARKGID